MDLRHAIDTYRGHTIPRFRFTEKRNVWFVVSGIFIALSLLGFVVRGGLNLSIDFKGGAEITYTLANDTTQQEISDLLTSLGHPESTVQVSDDGSQVSIRTEAFESFQERTTVVKALADQAGIKVKDIEVPKSIGATWGSEISSKAARGLVLVLLLIAVYISFRFEWKMSVGALIALAHDIIITFGVYSLTGRQVTPETIIAVLTILGFSLYDTIVIYDKINENTESAALINRYGYSGVVDLSLNQTFMRSVNTSLVVLLPILSLLFFGGETLKNFAFAMFVGVTAGTYSSIFIAAPILTLLKGREPKYRKIEEKLASQRQSEPIAAKDGADHAAPVGAGVSAAANSTSSSGASKPPARHRRKPPSTRRKHR